MLQLSSSVPSKDGLVDHLSERGFQVVAAGVSEQDMRVLFCARQVRQTRQTAAAALPADAVCMVNG